MVEQVNSWRVQPAPAVTVQTGENSNGRSGEYSSGSDIVGMYCVCTETTAQVRAEAGLRQVNERLENKAADHASERDRIWRMSKDILAVGTLDGRFSNVSPALTDILGWTAQEVMAAPSFLKFAHPEQRDEVARAVGGLTPDAPLVDFQVRSLHKDGSYRWLSWSVTVEGRKLYGVARDVTELRQRQSRLDLANNARLSMALEAGKMGAWSWNIQSDVTTWWPGMAMIHGLDDDTIPNLDLYRTVVHPDDWARIEAAIEAVLGGRQWHRIEYRVVWPDGDVHWIEGRSEAFFDQHGNAIEVAGICLDITARKRAEQDTAFIANASAELSELVDYHTTLTRIANLAVPHFADWCAIDLLDEQGILQRVAVAHVDPGKVALAHELHETYPPDPAAEGGIWKVIRTASPDLYSEITNEMLEASIADREYLAAIKRLGFRSYVGVPLCRRGKAFGAITFITAESRRLYTAEDLVLAEDLSRRAAVAIENARLYQALQEADKAKDRFIATLAHELRNPLAPIRQIPAVVGLSKFSPEVIKRSMEILDRQASNLTRLVDDLLDIARATTGKIELEKEEISLNEVLGNAIETCRQRIEKKGLTVHVLLPERPGAIWADRVRMEQVFTNIIANATKFSEPGGRIDIVLNREERENVIRIRDTGIGISPEMLESIFSMFVQEKTPQQHAKGGLGIGLALVRKLVTLHGGTVEASSEGYGKGAEFVVRLPDVSPGGPHFRNS